MKKSDMPSAERKLIRQRIKNAMNLALGPILELKELSDTPQAKYFTSYVNERIAIIERTEDSPMRTIAIFPATEDGKIAANRYCDSLNSEDGLVSTDDLLSFEKA